MSKYVTKSAYELITGWPYTYKQDRAKQTLRDRQYKKRYERQKTTSVV
jgi:hypothetical protein